MQPRGCIFYAFVLVVIMGRRKSVDISEDVLARLKFIRRKRQEYFICLSLNTCGEIISRRTVTIGTLNATLIHPREVFVGALKDHAASVIVAHNHPSGYAMPSDKDIEITQQLVSAGQILGIPLQDHLIMAKEEVFSFRVHLLII
jgi:DNA repair protein RadC